MNEPKPFPRRHDLDALRAIAMLLGIALHAGLAYLTAFPWIIQDSQKAEWIGIFFAATHGFRMPLFFLISGFFTAMLWRKRGLPALLHHRFKRIFIPCIVGLITLVPLTFVISYFAVRSTITDSNPAPPTPFVIAIQTGDINTVTQQIQQGVNLNQIQNQATPLMHATLHGRQQIVKLLIDHGADVNLPSSQGSTPLHSAVFFGRLNIVDLLLKNGANPTIANNKGERPTDYVSKPFTHETGQMINFIATLLKIKVDMLAVKQNMPKIAQLLNVQHAESQRNHTDTKQGLIESYHDKLTSDFWVIDIAGNPFHLLNSPFFNHLWFLWFLCMYVVAFILYAYISTTFNLIKLPDWFMISPLNLLWLIPLTIIPQLFMSPTGGFGPDTSTGLIPHPHVFIYYAIFFYFGVVYFDNNDHKCNLGKYWWAYLPLAAIIFLLSVGIFYHKPHAFTGLSLNTQHIIALITQVAYAWLMTFGAIGLFHKLLSKESKVMRYVSDSSYWLYLAHLPLILLLQWWTRDWNLPAIFKFFFITTLCSIFLLITYEYCIRYTPIGTMLNGKKTRNHV